MKWKKQILIFTGASSLIILSIIIYVYYFSNPSEFPSDRNLVSEMNQLYPEANVSKIQDTVIIDEKHIFVPFISNDDLYGTSFWEWKKRRWEPISINSVGEPRIWMINKSNPSTYHLVWNIHPDDKMNYFKFYLIQDRSYHITLGVHNYQPRIQMEKKITFEGDTYGTMQLPKDWSSIIDSLEKVSSNNFFLTGDFFQNKDFYFGWNPYGHSNKEYFPERSVNGISFSTGGIFEHVSILSEEGLELP
ncbi:hypothetical protein [Fredinandcohnia quinoae]|uniref:Uncharacterized protein n=1 Tax=Fredinandcohnia quinoae TaxID=2918902 RepID=A0AAW5DUJ1_9BACI|nr:hypothetical protein [Fredinandcohnia sp. SECRCQ15]MCH1624300.1 hypothetical protein [Fredinandcohnia sp. SECRCQ15]